MSHPNIVKLKEVIRENDILFFVFEYMVSYVVLQVVPSTLCSSCFSNAKCMHVYIHIYYFRSSICIN